MTHTAIFLGGPADGQLLTVEDPLRHVVVPQVDTETLFREEEESPFAPLPLKKVTYESVRISFFGANLLAFTPTDLSDAGLQDAAVRHLLAPNARAALV